MYSIVEVTGHIGGECFLILSDEGGVLFDTGFGYCAGRMADNVQRELAGRPLLAVLLTHTHYDHAMGCSEIKRRYPDALVVCSKYAAKIFDRSGALEVMRSMDAGAAADAGWEPVGDTSGLQAERVLTDGEILTLPGFVVQAMNTPGHTNCSMSFYFPEKGLLALSETTGVAPFFPEVIPAFLVGYQVTLDSLERCRGVKAPNLLVPHTGLLTGGDVETFFENAGAAIEKTATYVLDRFDGGEDPEQIIDSYRQAFYDESWADIQPERAFVMNANAMIPRLLRETGRLTAG